MPQVIIYALEGRSASQKEALMKAITDAVALHFRVASERVSVQIVESAADPKPRGDIPHSKLP